MSYYNPFQIKSNKKKGQLLIIFLILLILFFYLNKKNTDRHIKKNLKIGVAYIYKAYLDGRYSVRRVSYTIIGLHNGHLDSFDVPCEGRSNEVFRNIENKYFPVVYDSTNIRYNDLILEKSDFEKYDIPWKEGL